MMSTPSVFQDTARLRRSQKAARLHDAFNRELGSVMASALSLMLVNKVTASPILETVARARTKEQRKTPPTH